MTGPVTICRPQTRKITFGSNRTVLKMWSPEMASLLSQVMKAVLPIMRCLSGGPRSESDEEGATSLALNQLLELVQVNVSPSPAPSPASQRHDRPPWYNRHSYK